MAKGAPLRTRIGLTTVCVLAGIQIFLVKPSSNNLSYNYAQTRSTLCTLNPKFSLKSRPRSGLSVNVWKHYDGPDKIVEFPATPAERLKRIFNWGKEDGFLPGTAGKEYFYESGKKWDPATGGGHPDFDFKTGPYGEKLDYYGEHLYNPLDPENWIGGMDKDAADHMLGIPRPKERTMWDKFLETVGLKEADTYDYSKHYFRPGGEGTDDYRMWPEEDINGNGPGDPGYLGYNMTLKNGTTVFVAPPEYVNLDFYRQHPNGTWEFVHVPEGEKRPPMYDNLLLRFHEKMLNKRKVVTAIGGGPVTELGHYGPIWHLVGDKTPDDPHYHDPRFPSNYE